MIDLTPLVQVLISVLALLITTKLIPWLKTKLTTEKQAVLADLIVIAVAAAEQLYTGSGRGAEKYNYVVGFLETKGFTVDLNDPTDELRVMIEAAVYDLKN